MVAGEGVDRAVYATPTSRCFVALVLMPVAANHNPEVEGMQMQGGLQ